MLVDGYTSSAAGKGEEEEGTGGTVAGGRKGFSSFMEEEEEEDEVVGRGVEVTGLVGRGLLLVEGVVEALEGSDMAAMDSQQRMQGVCRCKKAQRD
jgi:hypothetical protein